jgi:hypothetical protein
VTGPDRIPCLVPFCRRTAARERFPGVEEIICGKHWRTSAWRTRKLYYGVQRKLRRWPNDERLRRLEWRLWERCKRQVLQAAEGLR